MYKVVLLEDYDFVHNELIVNNLLKAFIAGIVWKYIPDFTYKNRDFMVVDGPTYPSK